MLGNLFVLTHKSKSLWSFCRFSGFLASYSKKGQERNQKFRSFRSYDMLVISVEIL